MNTCIRILAAILCIPFFSSTLVAQSNQTDEKNSIEIVSSLDQYKPAEDFNEDNYAGYILAYFKDQTQSAYLAISSDGYSFTDLNDGEPIFIGEQLAEQKGVRDPHITRGPDGAFYLAMTDLHIYGKRAGFRDTEWQRPIEEHGWGNNRALVLMKSYDLIHWTHSDFRVDLAFPELGDIDCSWAPQTVYDPVKKKMMVYFTIRYNDEYANIYTSYANKDFTKLVTLPKKIENIGGIDADLTKVGDTWQMHYVSQAQIFHSSSDKINEGFQPGDERINPDEVPTEAPQVFRRIGTETWVLMYDIYGGRPNNMGFSETTDFENYTNIGRFNESVMKTTNFERPKHGAITYLTKAELEAITKHWNVDLIPDE